MKRVEELTLRLLDGRLTDAEAAELEVLLQEPSARQIHVALMEQEAALRGLRAPGDLADATVSRIQRELAGIEEGVMSKIRTADEIQRARERAPWLGGWRYWALAAAALLLCAGGVAIKTAVVFSRDLSSQQVILCGTWRATQGLTSAFRVLVRDELGGEAIAGAAVRLRLLDGAGEVVWEQDGQTDAEGMLVAEPELPAELPDGDYRLEVAAETDEGTTEVAKSVRLERSYRVFVSTDKPLYQPGQRIHIRALSLASADLRPAAGQETSIEVKDGQGNKVFKRTLPASDYGLASVDVQLADEVNTGDYTIGVTTGDATSERTVRVERYVLPKFKVELSTAAGYYAPGDTLRGTLSARYTFGEPVVRGRVELTATALAEYAGLQDEFARVRGLTDAEGRFSFEVKLKDRFVGLPVHKGDASVSLEAKVTDGAGHTQARTLARAVSAQPIRVDAIPESGELVPGVENVLYVVTSYPDGTPAQTQVSLLGHEPVRTNAAGVAELRLPADAGTSLQLVAADDGGRRAQTRVDLAVAAQREGLLLRSDRATYSTGETAELTLLSAGGGYAYLDVIRSGQTALMKTVQLADGQGQLALDLPADLFGTLQLRAYKVLSDGSIVSDTKLIQVARASDLEIQATLDRETYRPGEKAVLDLLVRRGDDPVQAALSLSAVDEAVFALQESRPGLEKVYFTLQAELLEPRAQFSRHLPAAPAELVDPAPAGEASEGRELAAAVLVAGAKDSGAPGQATSVPYRERTADLRREQDEQAQAALGALALSPSVILLLLLLPLPVTAVVRRRQGRRLQGTPTATRALQDGLRSLLRWFVLGLYLPLVGAFGCALVFGAIRSDQAASAVLVLLVGVTAAVTHVVQSQRGVSLPWRGGTLAFFGLLLLVAVVGVLGADDGTVVAWFAIALALGCLALIGVRAWRVRQLPLAGRDPALRRASSYLPAGYLMTAVALVGLIAAGSGYRSPLDGDTAGTVLLGLLALLGLASGAFSAAWSSALEAISFKRWLWLGASRSALAVAPVFGLLLMSLLAVAGSRPSMDMATATADFAPMEFERALEAGGEAWVEEAFRDTDRSEAGLKAPTRIRRHFPETLLWQPQLITDARGRAQLEIPLADSITTWRLGMSAVSAQGDLGASTLGLRVFQEFFVDLDLPVALTQNDEVHVPVAVYNYLDTAQTVRVELQPAAWYEQLGESSATVELAPREVTQVRFPLRALKPGTHALQVKAYGSQLADALERQVRVEPDGQRVETVKNGSLDEDQQLEVAIPPQAIDDASKILVKLYPGVFSQVLDGIEGLLHMPGG